MGFLKTEEINRIGFAMVGKNVLISDKATIYNASNITIGDNVRIDDFCVLSAGNGGIQIGSFIHIAVYSCLIGKGLIKLSDFCNISSRVSIYSSNDDYSGSFMTNPMVDSKFTNVNHEDVYIGKHVIIGSGTVILPGSQLKDGAAIGALSLVSGQIPKLEIYAGTPAKFIKKRKENIFEIEKQNFK
jgi:acetyltransferase-like isoleucine patch superfamily enzyme